MRLVSKSVQTFFSFFLKIRKSDFTLFELLQTLKVSEEMALTGRPLRHSRDGRVASKLNLGVCCVYGINKLT